jgi:RNA 2',3'-cyclic 3'-phosphodiesterase
MRLFTGIDLPDDVLANLNRLVDGLRPTAHVKWTPAYNFHLTTKFIGEWPEDQLNQLIERLRSLENRSFNSMIRVEGIGWFPNRKNPKILWAGIHAGAELSDLAADTDKALGSFGVPSETKAYAPHLTLARIKDAVPLTPLREAIDKLESTDFGSFRPDRFHLYLSKPGPSGSIYTKLADFPLSNS